jgi:hypothetical protein
MTTELLTSIAAAILSLLASYLPGFSAWFNQFSADQKRLLMLGLLCLASALSYAAACSGVGSLLGITVTCDVPGLITLIRALLAAIVVNQSVFLLSPRGSRQPSAVSHQKKTQ